MIAWDEVTTSNEWKELSPEQQLVVHKTYLRDLGKTPEWQELATDEKFNVVRQTEVDAGFYKEPSAARPFGIKDAPAAFARGITKSYPESIIGKGVKEEKEKVRKMLQKQIAESDLPFDEKFRRSESLSVMNDYKETEPITDTGEAGLPEMTMEALGSAVIPVAELTAISKGLPVVGKGVNTLIGKIAPKVAPFAGRAAQSAATFGAHTGLSGGDTGDIAKSGLTGVLFTIGNMPASRVIKVLGSGAVLGGMAKAEGASEQDVLVNTIIGAAFGLLSPTEKAEIAKNPDKPLKALPAGIKLMALAENKLSALPAGEPQPADIAGEGFTIKKEAETILRKKPPITETEYYKKSPDGTVERYYPEEPEKPTRNIVGYNAKDGKPIIDMESKEVSVSEPAKNEPVPSKSTETIPELPALKKEVLMDVAVPAGKQEAEKFERVKEKKPEGNVTAKIDANGHYVDMVMPADEAVKFNQEAISSISAMRTEIVEGSAFKDVIKDIPTELRNKVKKDVKRFYRGGMEIAEAQQKALNNLEKTYIKEGERINKQIAPEKEEKSFPVRTETAVIGGKRFYDWIPEEATAYQAVLDRKATPEQEAIVTAMEKRTNDYVASKALDLTDAQKEQIALSRFAIRDKVKQEALQVESDGENIAPEQAIKQAQKATPSGISLKEQKKYLLSEVDTAIEKAPNEVYIAKIQGGESIDFNQTPFVQIEVPGDGIFKVVNSKEVLQAFRRKVNSKFPTKAEKQPTPSTTLYTEPSVTAEPVKTQPKEAWEMTVAEYEAKYGKTKKSATSYSENTQHKNIVGEAFYRGKPVPAEVLKDYPDLQKPIAKTTEAAPPSSEIKAGMRVRNLAGKSPQDYTVIEVKPFDPKTDLEGERFADIKNNKTDEILKNMPIEDLKPIKEKKTTEDTTLYSGLPAQLARNSIPEIIGGIAGGFAFPDEEGNFDYEAAFATALAVGLYRHLPIKGKTPVEWTKEGALGAADKFFRLPLLRYFHRNIAGKEIKDMIKEAYQEESRGRAKATEIGGKYKEKFTPEERDIISDILEKEGNVNTFTERLKKQAGIQKEANQHIGQKLVDLDYLSQKTYDAMKDTYAHRVYDSRINDIYQRLSFKIKSGLGLGYLMQRGEPSKVIRNREFAEGDKVFRMQRIDPDTEMVKTVYVKANEINSEKYSEYRLDKRPYTVKTIDKDKAEIWRDFSREQRKSMGEIRDIAVRTVIYYSEVSKDLAYGKLYQKIAEKYGSNIAQEGYVKVSDVERPNTGGMKKWGALGGKYIPKDIHTALLGTQRPWADNAIFKAYAQAMSLWKIGKTGLTPSTHVTNIANNINVSMLMGENPVDLLFQGGTAILWKDEFYKKAVNSGWLDSSIMAETDVKAMLQKLQGGVSDGSGMFQKAMGAIWQQTGGRMVKLYGYEDMIFKLGMFKKGVKRGMSEKDAMDLADKMFFDYKDLPVGAQFVRDFHLPFFSYTYKIIPLLTEIAIAHPERILAGYAITGGLNAAAYKYLYGDKAGGQEEYEREMNPEYMKGKTIFGTPHHVRLPSNKKDEIYGGDIARFLSIQRLVPGGDIFDIEPNVAGGMAWPQAFGLSPLGNNPALSIAIGLSTNIDPYFGEKIVKYKNPINAEEKIENAKMRIKFILNSVLPNNPVIPGSWSFDKICEALTASGDIPSDIAEYFGWTGKTYAGRNVEPKEAALSAVGVKIREVPLEERYSRRVKEEENALEEREKDLSGTLISQSKTAKEKKNQEEMLQRQINEIQKRLNRLQELKQQSANP